MEGAFHILAGFARALLDPSDQFLFFARDKLQVVISEFRPLLFDLAFEDVPIAFDFEFIHKCYLLCSFLLSGSAASRDA